MLSSLLFPTYKLSRKNTQPENDIVFEKAKGQVRTANIAGVYAEAAVRRVLKKTGYQKLRRIHKKTSVSESLFGIFL